MSKGHDFYVELLNAAIKGDVTPLPHPVSDLLARFERQYATASLFRGKQDEASRGEARRDFLEALLHVYQFQRVSAEDGVRWYPEFCFLFCARHALARESGYSRCESILYAIERAIRFSHFPNICVRDLPKGHLGYDEIVSCAQRVQRAAEQLSEAFSSDSLELAALEAAQIVPVVEQMVKPFADSDAECKRQIWNYMKRIRQTVNAPEECARLAKREASSDAISVLFRHGVSVEVYEDELEDDETPIENAKQWLVDERYKPEVMLSCEETNEMGDTLMLLSQSGEQGSMNGIFLWFWESQEWSDIDWEIAREYWQLDVETLEVIETITPS